MSTKPFFKGTSIPPEPDYMATALSLSQSPCAEWKIEITLDCQWQNTACTSQTSTHQVGNILGCSSFRGARQQPHIQHTANLFACQGYQRNGQARACQQANPWRTPFEISCCPPTANISEQTGAVQIPRSLVFSGTRLPSPTRLTLTTSPPTFLAALSTMKQLSSPLEPSQCPVS